MSLTHACACPCPRGQFALLQGKKLSNMSKIELSKIELFNMSKIELSNMSKIMICQVRVGEERVTGRKWSVCSRHAHTKLFLDQQWRGVGKNRCRPLQKPQNEIDRHPHDACC